MNKPNTAGPIRLIPVGGFLGSGKTTLLRRAAEMFRGEGKRVALITNDQAPGLVDTELLRRQGLAVGEVIGGCFCCRFDQLAASIESLADSEGPEIILAEPVGSCTDLSATVIRPLKQLYSKTVEVALFTVLVDPVRLIEVLVEGNQGVLSTAYTTSFASSWRRQTRSSSTKPIYYRAKRRAGSLLSPNRSSRARR